MNFNLISLFLILSTIGIGECAVNYALRYWGPGLSHPWGYGWDMVNPYWGLGYRYSLGYGFYGKRDLSVKANDNNRIECIFMSSTSMISCNRGSVECETTQNLGDLNLKFDMFGIEYNQNELRLYPKNFTMPTFGNYQMVLNNGATTLKLYSNDIQNDQTMRGLVIKDSMCFSKLLELFKSIQNPISVDIAGSNNQIGISGFVLDM